jgi:hypothetical protein
MDGDDGVLAIQLARQHRPYFAGLDVAGVLLEPAAEVVGHVLALSRPVHKDGEIVGLPAQRLGKRPFVLELAAALQDLLGGGLIFPEVGDGDLRLDVGQLALQAGFVKAPS